MMRLVGLGRYICVALALTASNAQAEPVAIVAAESVYGGIAREIGGASVAVKSILASVDADPHEFEASAGFARLLAAADVVVYNGAGYDPWIERLLSAAPSRRREVLEVAALAGKRPGDNPHLWYDPAAIAALATTLSARLAAIDPAHRNGYAAGLAAFDATLQPLRARIASLRARYAGTPVTATEPVFDYMAQALDLTMRNARFQRAMMNGTEPGARTIAAFEDDLRTRAVRVLIYNAQTGEALAQRMRALAAASGIPVVTITESEPPGTTYAQWMLSQLEALDRALAGR
jgi:zinc/manganese transport system substrate-binding protein